MPAIFLSHTFSDKPIVEPVAMALRDIFGVENVFYDSWSIQPGDGIIDRMNEGLKTPDFVFFFVSRSSLNSAMVKLEWQNALMKATHGKCRLIAVRVDGAEMPPLLLQSLYIDLFTYGIEAATRQIVNVVQGNTSFSPQHTEFSNLTWKVSGDSNGKLLVTISASHFMEPRPSFAFALANNDDEVHLWIEGMPAVHSGKGQYMTDDLGRRWLVLHGAPIGNHPIQPNFPIIYSLTATKGVPVALDTVMHQVGQSEFKTIPKGS